MVDESGDMRSSRAAALLFLALAGCSSAREVVTRSHSVAHRIDKVFVGTRGTIVLNGTFVNPAALGAELVKLKAAGGTLWYSREDSTVDPTGAQMAVFKQIVSTGVPIALFRDATFTGLRQ